MSLKCGITGFHSYKKVNELPSVGFEEFKRTLTGVMTSMGYKPKTFNSAGVTPNFHIGVFEKGKERISVICNSVYPVVALTLEPAENACELAYINSPIIENAITQYTEYEFLSKEYLETPFSKDNIGNLNEAEISQIKYWQPINIGEIVFNWWD